MPRPESFGRRLRTRVSRVGRAGDSAALEALQGQLAAVALAVQQLRDERVDVAARLNEIEAHFLKVGEQRHTDAWNAAQLRHEHVLQLVVDLHREEMNAAEARQENLVKLISTRFRRPTA